MRLFVANLSKQKVEFPYRILGESGLRTQHIPVGHQIRIAHDDLNTPQIDHIIAAHRAYGMVEASEISKLKNYAGLAYSIDKPVPIKGIQMALESNLAVLLQRGKENRQKAALAANQTIQHNFDELAQSASQEGFDAGNFTGMDVEITQLDNKHPSDKDLPPVAEAFRVTKDAETAQAMEQRRPSRNRRRGAA